MNKKIVKSIIILFIILVIFIAIFWTKYNEFKEKNKEIMNFNSKYEFYNREEINGLDIATLINKAIDNNEYQKIPKNEEGMYELDDEYSIEIYVKMIKNDKAYEMEKIDNLGMSTFIATFGEVHFNCIDTKYHEKTGRVASMTFESTEEY